MRQYLLALLNPMMRGLTSSGTPAPQVLCTLGIMQLWQVRTEDSWQAMAQQHRGLAATWCGAVRGKEGVGWRADSAVVGPAGARAEPARGRERHPAGGHGGGGPALRRAEPARPSLTGL